MDRDQVQRLIDRRLRFYGAVGTGFIAFVAGAVAVFLNTVAEGAVRAEIENATNETRALSVALFSLVETTRLEDGQGITAGDVQKLVQAFEFVSDDEEVRRNLRELGILDVVLNSFSRVIYQANLFSQAEFIDRNFSSDIALNADTCDNMLRIYGDQIISINRESDKYKSDSDNIFQNYLKYRRCARSVYPETLLFYDMMLIVSSPTISQSEKSEKIDSFSKEIEYLDEIDKRSFFAAIEAFASGQAIAVENPDTIFLRNKSNELKERLLTIGAYPVVHDGR